MDKIHILFISSNPIDKVRLELKEEFLSIENELRKSRYEDYFHLTQSWDTRIDELQDLLDRYKPDIVHFSGHGTSKNELILQKSDGTSNPISPDALKILFKSFSKNVQCVLLNACYSEIQAQSIAEEINFVIGASGARGDKVSIEFSRAFYRTIGNSKTIKEAFKLAQNAIELSSCAKNNITKLYSSVDSNYSFINRRIQANKIIKDIKKYAPAAAGGYLAARVWDSIKSTTASDQVGAAEGFEYSNVSELNHIVDNFNIPDVTDEVGSSVIGKVLKWFGDKLDDGTEFFN